MNNENTKILKDLGMFPMGNKGKFAKRILLECPECSIEYSIWKSNYKRNPKQMCQSCANRIKNITHGDAAENKSLYRRWCHIKGRCHTQTDQAYKNYGAKGITMCDEWFNSYESFKKWSIENGYEKNKELDKDILCRELNIEPKIYSPETCKWITKTENMKEMHRSRSK